MLLVSTRAASLCSPSVCREGRDEAHIVLYQLEHWRFPNTTVAEDSWRKFRLKPTGITCVVFQVPTPPNNNFSCYQIISHRAIPPSIKSYRTNAVSRLISDGCTAKEKNPVLLLKTLLWQSFLYAMVSPLPMFISSLWWLLEEWQHFELQWAMRSGFLTCRKQPGLLKDPNREERDGKRWPCLSFN